MVALMKRRMLAGFLCETMMHLGVDVPTPRRVGRRIAPDSLSSDAMHVAVRSTSRC